MIGFAFSIPLAWFMAVGIEQALRQRKNKSNR